MKRIIKAIITVLTYILLATTALVLATAIYIRQSFPEQGIDEMLFYLTSGLEGTSNDVFITGIQQGIIPFLIILLFLILPLIKFKKRENRIEISIRKKKLNIHIFPLRRLRLIYALFTLAIALFACYKMLGVDEYLDQLNAESTFIEDHYVSGTDVSITFPEEKRSLIILYLESMENSFIDRESGGGWPYTVIPELEQIARENINFSNTGKIGGPLPTQGTDWTVASLFSTTSGLPLKIPVGQNRYRYSDDFMPGAYALGDILKQEGYQLSAMFGSNAKFGGRKNYYKSHGDYKVFDVNTAIHEGKMTASEKVWWGFDDSDLFKWAKEEISTLAQGEQPFNFTFLTANTHFTDGYLEEGAGNKYDTQYENVYAYSSKQVQEFVTWLKGQDFYENTTLVILGDHLSMQGGGFFPAHLNKEYQRTIYNAFLNTTTKPVQPKNRTFSLLDMYPTILASIGVNIEGDRLGLGTNLFSDKQTLFEQYGRKHVNDQLAVNSRFYNQNILQDDYLELLKQAEEEQVKEKKEE
ncbi:LTA synthase family protein [Salinibacillus aidingensis]|uniref:LTA synthase family protein n=1 Tax=Salinibacillus aidingensis TaxID=237684 RepID=A0ABN1AYW9_9BACI